MERLTPRVCRLGLAFLITLVTIVPHVDVAAQNHQANYIISGSTLQLLKGDGTFTTIFNNVGRTQGGAMDVDNRHILYGQEIDDGWFRVDPNSSPPTRSTILLDSNLFNICGEIDVDQNGDYIVTGRGPAQNGIYRISGGAASTITAVSTLAAFTGGMVRDIDSGDLILPLIGVLGGPHPIVRVTQAGVVTTIIMNYTADVPLYQLTQDLRTGSLYVGTGGPTGWLLEISRQGQVNPVKSETANSAAFAALVADRASDANPRLISTWRSGLFYTDIGSFAITTVAITGTATSPRAFYVYGGRNIQPVKTGARSWQVRLSFPAHPGKGYVFAMTASGVRPGVPLSDGRRIWINVDALTAATVNDLIRPTVSAGPGILDANGEAQASINLLTLGIPTFRVHLIAAVLDRSAPLGIAAIADPYVMNL